MHYILDCIFLIFLGMDQYLPPPKRIMILSALVFRPGYDNNNRHNTQHIIKI